jgi:heme/copper-type cytochrome/quinol oxidase subunit 2
MPPARRSHLCWKANRAQRAILWERDATTRPRERHRWRTILILTVGAGVILLAGVLAAAPLLGLRSGGPTSPGAQTVVISMAGFTPKSVVVRAGTPVQLRIENPDSQFHTDGGGWHQFAIDEIRLDVRIPPHSTRAVTLPALSAGRYEFYCDVCCGGRINPSMIGVLEVRG